MATEYEITARWRKAVVIASHLYVCGITASEGGCQVGAETAQRAGDRGSSRSAAGAGIGSRAEDRRREGKGSRGFCRRMHERLWRLPSSGLNDMDEIQFKLVAAALVICVGTAAYCLGRYHEWSKNDRRKDE